MERGKKPRSISHNLTAKGDIWEHLSIIAPGEQRSGCKTFSITQNSGSRYFQNLN
jgi:hypothetical protein